MNIFKRLGLKAKLMLGSCSPLILMIILSGVTYLSIGSLLNSNHWVDHTHDVIAKAKSIEAAAVDMETGMRGFLLAGKEDFLAPYNNGSKLFYEQVKSLQKTVDDNPAQVQLLGEINDTIKEWQEKVTEPTIELRRVIAGSKTMDDMRDLVGEARGKVYFDKFRGQIKTFIDREQALLEKRKVAADESNDIDELRETAKWVDHTHVVIQQANAILGSAVDMETGMRGYLLAGKEEFLDPYINGSKRFYEQVKSLQKTVNDNPAQVKLLDEINGTIKEWQEKVTEPTIALRREIGDAKSMNDMAKLIGEARGKVYFDKFRGQIKTFTDREAELMGIRQAEAADTASQTNYAVIFGTILTILIALATSYLLSRSVVNPINHVIAGLTDGADQVASASGEVSSSSQSLAEGSSEQAASIEETSSSLEEMSSMTKQNADNAGQADSLMQEANQVVSQANHSMSELTGSMEEISKASEETSKIIKTIDEIAFQTNLLALNAAVEAARAGEAGAGFAVVADEVRNLAMRAADAAKNTAELIEGTVKKVDGGSEIVTRTNEAFAQVADSSAKVGELVAEIAAASNEQAQGIEQVNTAVTEMDKVTQSNAANAEESASASEEMSAQAEQMKAMVGDLVALVGGSSTSNNDRIDEALHTANADNHRALEYRSAAPAKKVDSKAAVFHQAKEVNPEQLIPMEDESFKDF